MNKIKRKILYNFLKNDESFYEKNKNLFLKIS